MERILIEFVDTLDQSLKKLQCEVGDGSGFVKLTINQLHYIDAVYSLGEPTITEIAEKLKITKASVTTGINKLILLGYVDKKQSTIDRRVFHVRLTDPAQELIQARFQALHDYGEFVRAALSEEEARQFQMTLTKIVQLFKNQ
jgi:DNA-binding MarR family transcriptional regulator